MNREKQIVDILVALRKKNKISQAEMKSRINLLHVGNYPQKEKFNHKFKMSEILRMCSILDVKFFINDIEIGEYNSLFNLEDIDIKGYESLVSFIFKTRRNNKITQDEMKNIIGVKSHPAYNQKELGKSFFTLEEVVNFCNYFEFPIKLSFKDEGREKDIYL